MNWLDIGLIVLVGVSAVVGMRIGLISATLAVVGVFLGLSVAGQVTEEADVYSLGMLTYELLAFEPRSAQVRSSMGTNDRATAAEKVLSSTLISRSKSPIYKAYG